MKAYRCLHKITVFGSMYTVREVHDIHGAVSLLRPDDKFGLVLSWCIAPHANIIRYKHAPIILNADTYKDRG